MAYYSPRMLTNFFASKLEIIIMLMYHFDDNHYDAC